MLCPLVVRVIPGSITRSEQVTSEDSVVFEEYLTAPPVACPNGKACGVIITITRIESISGNFLSKVYPALPPNHWQFKSGGRNDEICSDRESHNGARLPHFQFRICYNNQVRLMNTETANLCLKRAEHKTSVLSARTKTTIVLSMSRDAVR
jgi:hypothetical protein